MKKHHFKEIESGIHKHAKEDLSKWIENDPALIFMDEIIRVELERPLCMGGVIIFKPDIVVYDKDGIKKYIEICHKHAVDLIKLNKISLFHTYHNWNGIELIEVSAKWVLDQCEQPKVLKILNRFVI